MHMCVGSKLRAHGNASAVALDAARKRLRRRGISTRRAWCHIRAWFEEIVLQL